MRGGEAARAAPHAAVHLAPRAAPSRCGGRGTLPAAIAPEPLFVPAVIEPEPMTAVVSAPRKKRSRRACSEATAVELVIDGVAVKIARGADAGVIAAVIDALKTVQ